MQHEFHGFLREKVTGKVREMKQLSGQDNAFLDLEKMGMPQHISSLSIYDQGMAPGGRVRFKQILAHLESRLHLSPLFRSKLLRVPGGLDRPYLVDEPKFDLEYHVRHIALPQPGDWRQLCILVARINARPLDMSRPLWELYVIEGLDGIEHIPGAGFALLTRIHHCVMDGASGAEMMAVIHDSGPQPRDIEKEEVRIVEAPPSAMAMYGRAYINSLRRPQRIFKLGAKLISRERSRRHKGTAAARRMVETRFNGPRLSPHRVLDAVTLDFAEVRAIKNSLKGATINDVLLSVIAGALHKYLNARGELPGENLSCGCPVDVRDENERNSGGNVVGLMGVNLHTEIADPWQRFVATHEASVAGGKHAHASDVRINREIIDTVPGGLMTTALRVSAATGVNVTPCNTMLTNVPGPPNPLYFAGAQLVDGFGIGPLIPRIGLFHTASSTVMNKQGRINLSFWACRDMLPDPQFYRECIEASYAELRTVAAHQAG